MAPDTLKVFPKNAAREFLIEPAGLLRWELTGGVAGVVAEADFWEAVVLWKWSEGLHLLTGLDQDDRGARNGRRGLDGIWITEEDGWALLDQGAFVEGRGPVEVPETCVPPTFSGRAEKKAPPTLRPDQPVPREHRNPPRSMIVGVKKYDDGSALTIQIDPNVCEQFPLSGLDYFADGEAPKLELLRHPEFGWVSVLTPPVIYGSQAGPQAPSVEVHSEEGARQLLAKYSVPLPPDLATAAASRLHVVASGKQPRPEPAPRLETWGPVSTDDAGRLVFKRHKSTINNWMKTGKRGQADAPVRKPDPLLEGHTVLVFGPMTETEKAAARKWKQEEAGDA